MRRRHHKPAEQHPAIFPADRMKRLAACVGIAGFFLACLVAVLNYRQYLQPWQTKTLAVILIAAIVITLAYGSLWHWIYNALHTPQKQKPAKWQAKT